MAEFKLPQAIPHTIFRANDIRENVEMEDFKKQATFKEEGSCKTQVLSIFEGKINVKKIHTLLSKQPEIHKKMLFL
jgi:hypothetical protein